MSADLIQHEDNVDIRACLLTNEPQMMIHIKGNISAFFFGIRASKILFVRLFALIRGFEWLASALLPADGLDDCLFGLLCCGIVGVIVAQLGVYGFGFLHVF